MREAGHVVHKIVFLRASKQTNNKKNAPCKLRFTRRRMCGARLRSFTGSYVDYYTRAFHVVFQRPL